MNRQNWDDVRFVLAVAKHGSLNAAAASLGVTHATVLRRIAAFETRYGRPVFDKDPSGYRLLDSAQQILDAAGSVEDAMFKLERSVSGSDPSPSGRVRVASTDSMCQRILPAAVHAVATAFPGIEITLLSGNDHLDLSRLSADIVVRPAERLGDGLIGQQAGAMQFGVYAQDPSVDLWLGLNGALRRSSPAQWMEAHLSADVIGHGADSFLVLQHLAALGQGKTFLPDFLGDVHPGLMRVHQGDPGIAVPIWIATLEEIHQTPRFRIVRNALKEQLAPVLDPDRTATAMAPG